MSFRPKGEILNDKGLGITKKENRAKDKIPLFVRNDKKKISE